MWEGNQLIQIQRILESDISLYQLTFFTALFLTFEQNEYIIREGDGLLNNSVIVEKQDGRASEQILPVLVQLQLGSAQRG